MPSPLKYTPPAMASPTIALSWQRSERAGLAPHDLIEVCNNDYDTSSKLLAAAKPVLAKLADTLAGTSAGGLLADRSATLVDSYFGNDRLAAATERIGGRVGSVFDEENTGTNAVATCFETRKPVTIEADEHYLDCLKGFSCYGSPIINPVSGRLEGVIDLMVDGHSTEPLMQAVVGQAVAEITSRLILDYDPDIIESVRAFNALTRRTDDAVVLFSRDFILHNRRSADAIASIDLESLGQLAHDIGGNCGPFTLELHSGKHATVESVSLDRKGMTLLRIRDGIRTRPIVPRPAMTTLSVTENLNRRLAELAESSSNTLIWGERGAGRSSAGIDVAGPDAVILYAPSISAVDPGELVDRVVLIEDIQSLDAASTHIVEGLARRTRRLIVTATEDARTDPSMSYLGSLCPEWVELPPLRERLADLPDLTTVILRQLSITAAQHHRLTQPTMDLLQTHRWPGNLAEFRSVLEYALRRRPVGDITIDDLPHRYQSKGRIRAGLTPFELAEYDLIERSLAIYGGNKVRTARHLGISRSKLYARLRYFRAN